MRIAVIGDYESREYRNLILTLKAYKEPDDYVLDLSRHKEGSWTDMRDARWLDIDSAHQVILSDDCKNRKLDVMVDIDKALKLGKELVFFHDGETTPSKDYAYRG